MSELPLYKKRSQHSHTSMLKLHLVFTRLSLIFWDSQCPRIVLMRYIIDFGNLSSVESFQAFQNYSLYLYPTSENVQFFAVD